MPSGQPYRQLTPEQADHFVQHGWVKIDNCFTREAANYATRDVWVRLGMSPTDKSTWHTEQNGMPTQNRWPIKDFAPKAWAALCDVVGDENLIVNKTWNDGFIVNLGSPEGEGKDIPANEWHVDGQRWVNFLDSSEQGLLLMPLYSDIRPGGGGTMIAPAALPILLQHLHDHPEGVMPGLVPVGQERPKGLRNSLPRRTGMSMPPETLVEVTGNVGDVYILHPFMLHSRANNKHRDIRIVTNNNFPLKEPFQFDRSDPSQYSLIERATLKALGRENLKGWKATGKREKFAQPYAKRGRGTQKERQEGERARVAERLGRDHDYKLF